MGRFVFRLPDIGEGIAEAEIVAWHVKPGDTVEEDGRLADLMTDKATVEMESPVAGKVLEVAGEVGDTIAIGTPLVVLETASDVAEEPAVLPAPTAPAVEERIEVETPDAGDVEDAAEAVEEVEKLSPLQRRGLGEGPVAAEAKSGNGAISGSLTVARIWP